MGKKMPSEPANLPGWIPWQLPTLKCTDLTARSIQTYIKELTNHRHGKQRGELGQTQDPCWWCRRARCWPPSPGRWACRWSPSPRTPQPPTSLPAAQAHYHLQNPKSKSERIAARFARQNRQSGLLSLDPERRGSCRSRTTRADGAGGGSFRGGFEPRSWWDWLADFEGAKER